MKQEKWISLLSAVAGIEAIVIGGSRSRGEADEKSDTDIGIYYNENQVDWCELENALKTLMDETRLAEKVLYLPGEWGPWVNGGAWLTVDGEPFDVILRNTKRVAEVIADCIAGRITVDYQTGHPFGFVNAIYAAEVHYAFILWESDSLPVSQMKENLQREGKLPPQMKETLISRFLFEADFSMRTGRAAALKGDMHYIMGCFFRTVTCWNQVLYALNDTYFMNEKGSMKTAKQFPIAPGNYQVRVDQAYFYFGEHNPVLGFEEFELLQKDMEELVEIVRKSQIEIQQKQESEKENFD